MQLSPGPGVSAGWQTCLCALAVSAAAHTRPAQHHTPGRAPPFRGLQGFFAEVREVDRDNEVNRILGAFKLNPFEQLGIRFDATLDDAKRQYRKASLLVRAAPSHGHDMLAHM